MTAMAVHGGGIGPWGILFVYGRRSPTRTPVERSLRRGAIAPANAVVKTGPNVGLGDEMAALGYHFLTRRKVYATTSATSRSIAALVFSPPLRMGRASLAVVAAGSCGGRQPRRECRLGDGAAVSVGNEVLRRARPRAFRRRPPVAHPSLRDRPPAQGGPLRVRPAPRSSRTCGRSAAAIAGSPSSFAARVGGATIDVLRRYIESLDRPPTTQRPDSSRTEVRGAWPRTG